MLCVKTTIDPNLLVKHCPYFKSMLTNFKECGSKCIQVEVANPRVSLEVIEVACLIREQANLDWPE